MTALSAALPTPPSASGSAPKSGARVAGAGNGDGESNAFAKALQRRQSAEGGSEKTRRASSDPAPSAPEADAGVDRSARSTTPDTAPAAAPVVDGQQASPVWPPVGLAGLLGFADDTAASVQAAEDATAAEVAGAAPGAGGLDPAAVRTLPAAPLASALPIAPGLGQGALPDDAAIALPGLALEPAASAEGGEPTPVAFVLPTPVALREPPPLLAAPLPTPEVGAEDFEARFGAQLEWMADRKIGEARIRVTPNDLGPVEVRLHLDGDRLRADFVSANAETRQALEQGLPRLRDLLGEHGFQLSHANVGSGQGGGTRSDTTAPQQGAGHPGDDMDGSARTPALRPRMLGLLDAYA